MPGGALTPQPYPSLPLPPPPSPLFFCIGFYLHLVWKKAHQVFVPAPVETEAPYSGIALVNPGLIPADYDAAGGNGGGGGGLTPGLALSSPHRPARVGVDGAVGKQGGGGASAGGLCGVRRAALMETFAHLAFLSAMSVSLVDVCGGGGWGSGRGGGCEL